MSRVQLDQLSVDPFALAWDALLAKVALAEMYDAVLSGRAMGRIWAQPS
jgi:hypothetical protein